MSTVSQKQDEEYINIQEWEASCPDLAKSEKLYRSRKRDRHLYDEDYVYGEYPGSDTENPIQRTKRAMSQIVTIGTAHNVKKYVQYFILYLMVTEPKYVLYDHRFKKKEEEELFDGLKMMINRIFYKETHPGLNDNKYLKTILKNKRRLLTCVIKKIMNDHPSVYEYDDLILKYTLNYPGIRPLYPISYYRSAAKDYKDTYGEEYPILQIDETYYYQLINKVKQMIPM